MKYYLDTNIWIGFLVPMHPKNTLCKKLIFDTVKQNVDIVTSGHCLAEVYSVLTKLPPKLRLPPTMAVDIIEKNIVQKCQIVDLTYQEYLEVLKYAATKNLVSGVIFDGLHVKAALKVKVDKIYTFNLRDFKRFYIPEKVTLTEPK